MIGSSLVAPQKGPLSTADFFAEMNHRVCGVQSPGQILPRDFAEELPERVPVSFHALRLTYYSREKG